MSTKNIDTFRNAHQAFTRHDFDALLALLSDRFVYRDAGTGAEFKGKEGFRQFINGWKTAAKDASVANATYIDGGKYVIAQFKGRGTNDGPLGSFPATGKKFEVEFCEIIEFDDAGKMVSGKIYYDQLSLLGQLGHVNVPQKKAA